MRKCLSQTVSQRVLSERPVLEGWKDGRMSDDTDTNSHFLTPTAGYTLCDFLRRLHNCLGYYLIAVTQRIGNRGSHVIQHFNRKNHGQLFLFYKLRFTTKHARIDRENYIRSCVRPNVRILTQRKKPLMKLSVCLFAAKKKKKKKWMVASVAGI